MRYTPVELRHVKIERTMFGGYKRRETQQLIEDIADSFEDVWRERGELTDKLEDVEQRFGELKQRESLLASTLVSAERAAVDAKDAAKREAELIISEAHQEARSVTRSAQGERERLFAEARRVETLLRAALGLVEESRELPFEESREPAPEGPSVPPAVDFWPKRDDTREFQSIEGTKTDADEPGDDEPGDDEPGASGVLPTLPPVATAAEDEEERPWAGRDFAWG
jgi:cell division initiation protein